MKNKNFRKLILSIASVALLIAVAVSVAACGKPEPTETIDITYTESKDSVEITGYEGVLAPSATLEIPSSINGKPVKSIASEAFAGKEDLVEIFIPASITEIGEGAFEDCTALVTINFPNSLTEIAANTFSGCTSLKSVIIPANITAVGDNAFKGCKNLEKITISKSTTDFGKNVFKNCKNIKTAEIPTWVLGMLNTKNLETLTVTGGTSISNSDIKKVSALKSITIPDYVTEIDSDVFDDATEIENLTAPGWALSYFSLTNVRVLNVIGDATISFGMLQNSKNIEKLTIPYIGASKDATASTESHIGYAFGAPDASANALYIPRSLKSVVITNASVVADKAFYGCANITSVILSSTIESIGAEAFYGCKNLTSVNIPARTSTIGKAAFSGTNIEEIIIPDTVTVIEENVFASCKNLKSITVGRAVERVKPGAFESCDSLSALYIYDVAKWCGVEFDSYYDNPLFYATKLYVDGELVKKLEIPETVTAIKDHTFFRCTNVENIVFLGNVEKIGDYAFTSCVSLKSINLPQTLTTIGHAAFSNCKSLTEITIPSSVNSLGSYAFNLCASLKTVTIDADINTIPESAFAGCTSISELTVPSSVKAVEANAFAECEKIRKIVAPACVLNKDMMRNVVYAEIIGGNTIEGDIFAGTGLASIVIGDSITTIKSGAFAGCDKLENVTISPTSALTAIGSKAFEDCYKLTCIVIPENASSIADDAFAGCYRLAVVYKLCSTVNVSAPNVYKLLTDINVETGYINSEDGDDYLFLDNNGESILIGYLGSKSALELPAASPYGTAYTIGMGAFIGLGLQSVVIPENVIVNDNSFIGCGTLTKVSAPVDVLKYIDKTNVTSITITGGDKLTAADLLGCDNLSYIYICDSITAIDEDVFNVLAAVESIEIDQDNNSFKVDGNALYSKDGKTLYKVFSSVAEFHVTKETEIIGKYAFTGCTKLAQVIFDKESQVKEIPDFAFKNCQSLYVIELSASIEKIGAGIFYGCPELSVITVDENNTNYKVVDGCLIEISTKKVIGGCAFFSIPTDAEIAVEIGEYAFASNERVTQITISANISKIAETAFEGTSLYSINVDSENKFFKLEEGSLIEIATGKVIATIAS